MKPLFRFWFVLGLFSFFARAQNSFDRTWKLDLNSRQATGNPDAYLLQNGTYHCTTCNPPLEIPADGRDHKIAGDLCYDTFGIKVIDEHTIEETYKRNAKIVGTSKMTVSSDSRTATLEWSESCNANDESSTGKDVLTRLTEGPVGSHAISGSWAVSKRVNLSENALLITLKLTADTFSFADPTGQNYTAKLDGTETSFQGDLSHTIVSVKRLNDTAIEESDKHDGKITEVTRFTLSSDEKSMTIYMENKLKG